MRIEVRDVFKGRSMGTYYLVAPQNFRHGWLPISVASELRIGVELAWLSATKITLQVYGA